MARAADRRQSVAGHSIGSRRSTQASLAVLAAGPQPIGDFLPHLQTRMRWIPVRIWRDGCWQVAWVVIRNLEMMQVASSHEPRARRSVWRDHA